MKLKSFHELHDNELRDSARFIRNVFLFTLPFIFIFLLNYIVDPFNLNRAISLPLPKKATACYFNERLWKLNNFIQSPKKQVILGDSRAARFSEETLSKVTGKNFANLALSGATLIEIIDTFWFVSTHAVDEVVLCINFDRFNDWQRSQGVHEAVNIINNPLINYIQPQTCKAVGSLLAQYLFNSATVSQEPPMTRDVFWQYQIDEIDNGYQRYIFPAYASRQLSLIADYCKQHNIALSFIIFPTHSDLQERIDHAQLRSEERHFKDFLVSLAPVHDFDIVNDFTQNKSNFDDPKHVSYAAMDYLVSSVWHERSPLHTVSHVHA